MKKILILSVVSLFFAGCSHQVFDKTPGGSDTGEQGAVEQEITPQETETNERGESGVKVNNNTTVGTNSGQQEVSSAPQILSATFTNGNVVIQGTNLQNAYVAFKYPSPNGQVTCREMVTSNCVLQKLVATDTNITFNTNMIGANGTYEVYVEHGTSGASNVVTFVIGN